MKRLCIFYRIIIVLLMTLGCDLMAASAGEKLPAFDFKKIKPKYEPILGAKDGSRFKVFYCLPGFESAKEGKCGGLIDSDDLTSVEVSYYYGLNEQELGSAASYLEAFPGMELPVERNVNISEKTPYYNFYESLNLRVSIWEGYQAASEYKGFLHYKFKKSHFDVYISTPGFGYKTLLGNPEIIVCGYTCSITRDLGNGWLVKANFRPAAMIYAGTISRNFDKSIREMME